MRQVHGNSASVGAWEHAPLFPGHECGILQGQERQACQQGKESLENMQLSELCLQPS